MAKRKTKDSASNTDNAELTRKPPLDSDSTTTTCQTDMKEKSQKPNVEKNVGRRNGRSDHDGGKGRKDSRKDSVSQSKMTARKKQSVEVEQPGAATEDSGKEATGQPIPGSGQRDKWFTFVLLTVVLIAIMISAFSNTPATTKGKKTDLPPLEQKQDLSKPGSTEATPRIEAISISGNGESRIYVRGRFAREGDIVDGFKILKIHLNKVEFEKNGQTVVGVFPSGKN